MQQYIIDFVNDAVQEDIDQFLSTNNLTIVKTFSAFDKVFLVEAESMPDATALVESIIDDTDQSNHLKLLTTIPISLPVLPSEGSKTVTINDQKDWWKVYSGSTVDLDDETFNLPLSGKGSVVYVVDSGIKIDHRDFVDSDIELLYSFNEDFIDRKGHGTALSSVIVGKTCGITNAKLKVVKIFDKDVPTKLSDFLSALDSIYVDFSSLNMYGIVNCSWEIARNEYIESKLRTLWLSGVQIVVAAGNTSSVVGDVTPAAMPEAIVVGSYNATLQPSDFSDYAGAQAISVTGGSVNAGNLSGWAPGENIYAATLDDGFSYISGTSIAAAVHSAIIAYNVTLPALQFDDTINSIWNDSTRNNLSYFSKKDLLVLDDPKYQNSPNRASMLITSAVEPYYNLGPKPQLFMIVGVGILNRATIFNPLTVSSVVVRDPLPPGIVINNYGILAGYVESIEGESEVHNISLTFTDINGDSSDGELTITIKTINPQSIPTNVNENIPYELNAICRGQPCTEGTPDECAVHSCGGITVGCYCYKGNCRCAN